MRKTAVSKIVNTVLPAKNSYDNQREGEAREYGRKNDPDPLKQPRWNTHRF